MKKRLTKIGILSLGLLLGLSFHSIAQTDTLSNGRSGIILGVGPQANLPLGSFKDAYKWSIGGSVQADFPIVKNDLYVVVNAGFNNFFGKDNNIVTATGSYSKDLQTLPVQAGLKYYFPTTNLYIQGTAGASFILDKSDVLASKSASFIYTPQIGYLFKLSKNNYLDVAVDFQGSSKIYDAGKSYNSLGLRVAYDFSL
ncbi:MAG: hypothetical protein PW786_03355 [Arachidicoccus sp.]|nr:hypothetical protein [Arachidicoccus sp.]